MPTSILDGAGAAHWLDRQTLDQHSTDMRQFIDFRQSTLPDGQRLIEAYNASGLSFSILPDRGLDIWSAHYNGLPLTWISQGSPFLPDSGQSWLRQFNGGLLTTCGLTHAGPPETDAITGEQRDIHGRYSRLRAGAVAVSAAWQGDEYIMELTASVAESVLFGEQLRLTRTYRLTLGQPTIAITDVIENRGDSAQPLMLLYHVNLGYPLVRAGTRLHTASAHVLPRDPAAQAGVDGWATYATPQAGYAEQVFFHHLKAGADGWARVALVNGDLGFELAWDTATLPYFTQWKNTRQNMYVSGLEPGNCIPEGRNAAREHGRLVMLEPGDTRLFNVTLTALGGAAAENEARDRISTDQLDGDPVANLNLSGASSV